MDRVNKKQRKKAYIYRVQIRLILITINHKNKFKSIHIKTSDKYIYNSFTA